MGQNLLQMLSLYQSFLCVIIAYLLGSIPTSYLIGRIFFNTDIRQSGSGNTGATNALRSFGVKAGVTVLFIDVLKGVAAIIIAQTLMKSVANVSIIHLVVSISGLAVILGHVFSIFLGFKGGKGVATAAGVFLALQPLTFLYCLVLFGFVVKVSQYVSLGSVLSAFAFMMIEIVTQVIMKFPNKPRLCLVIMVGILIIIRHKANLKRLLDGTENKIVFGKAKQAL